MKILLDIPDQTIHVDSDLFHACKELDGLMEVHSSFDIELLRTTLTQLSNDDRLRSGLRALIKNATTSVNRIELFGHPEEDLEEGNVLIVTELFSVTVDANELKRAATAFERE